MDDNEEKALYTDSGEDDDSPSPTASSLSKPNTNFHLESVVKVFCVATEPNFSLPWQMKRQYSHTSSGFVISNKRILCNAHGVEHYSSVRVRKHGDSTKYSARVLSIGHECDLALVTVDDDDFWVGLSPLEFGGLPHLQDEVVVVGFPTGGDNISVTKGVVSRIDVTEYAHAGAYLLAIQIDAAINSGNSGGPTFRGNKVVGVAFETLDDAENIGYIVPVPVIEHFLQDISMHGRYTGFCLAGFFYQQLENRALRGFLKMTDKKTGVLISKLSPTAQAAQVLREQDVLMSIDGVRVAGDGTVKFRHGERVHFRHLTSAKFIGDIAKLTVWRDGKICEVETRMESVPSLVALHMYDRPPSWFVWGGLVFTVLTRPYLVSEYGKQWPKKAPIKLCELAFEGIKKSKDHEIVVMSHVLVDDVNLGYQDSLYNCYVRKVNDIKVRSLRHLVEIIENGPEPYVKFLLDTATILVLDRKEAADAEERILRENNISSAKSPDLLISTTGAGYAMVEKEDAASEGSSIA